MSQFQRVAELTASDHDEGEASGGERQGLPVSPVIAKRKPGRPPLPPGLRKPPRPKSNRPMGRPGKYPKPTEEDNPVTGAEIGPDLTQPKRNHESSEERLSSDLDDDFNEYRTSDRPSKQALHDTGGDRGSIGTVRREKGLVSRMNTRLDVEGFDIQNTNKQIRQGYSRQLIDDGSSAWAPGEFLATVGRTHHEEPMGYRKTSKHVPFREMKSSHNRRTEGHISELSDDAVSPRGRACHDYLTGYSTQNWSGEEQGENLASTMPHIQKKRRLNGPRQTVDSVDLESQPTDSRLKPITAEDLHGTENRYQSRRHLNTRSNRQVRDQAKQTGPDKCPPTSVDCDHLHPSQRYKRRYGPGSENAQQDVFSQHRDAGEILHSVGNELMGINLKGLSDKSPKSTTVIQSSDEEGLQMQVELFHPRQLAKTVTKEFFEEHLDWLECHEVPVDFNKFWSKEDEFELLWHWSQEDEDMHNAFVSQEMPLSIDMKRIWGLTPPGCLPDGLEFSIQDNDLLEDGRQNTNLSASTCDFLHTCLLLPAFRDALPFFHFMVKMAVYLRLRNSPYEVEKPREVGLMTKANKDHLTRIDEIVKSHMASFRDSTECDGEKAAEELIDELSHLEVNRSRVKVLNGYDHLAMRHELRPPRSGDTHDMGVTPGDLSAILDAWRIYAEKSKLRQAPWYRADHELHREASDVPSRTYWARLKKSRTMSKLRSAKVSSRNGMAAEKARIFHTNHMKDKADEVGLDMSREGHTAGTTTKPRQQITTPGVTGARKPSPVLRSVSGQNPKSSGQVQSSISQHLGNENASKRREAREATPKIRSAGDVEHEASGKRTQQMRTGRGSLSGPDIREPVADTRSAPINPDDFTAEVRELVQHFLDSSQDRHTPVVDPSNPTTLMVKQAKPMATAVGKTGKTVPAPAEAEDLEERPITALTETKRPTEKYSKEANKLNTTRFTDTARYGQYDSLTDESYESDISYDDEELVDMRLVFVHRWDPNLEIVEPIYVSTEHSSFLSASRVPKVLYGLRFGGQYIKDNFEQ